jgi:hypothetical protein
VLFDSATKTVDAKIFFKEMDSTLTGYRDKFNMATWESDEWKKLRKKMKGACANI